MPAVAAAFAYLCDPGPNLDLVILENWFEEAEAHAFAQVRACTAVGATLARPCNQEPSCCARFAATSGCERLNTRVRMNLTFGQVQEFT